MLHIALCDDNPASIEILEKYFDILNDSTIDYDVYFSAEELYRYKLNNELTYTSATGSSSFDTSISNLRLKGLYSSVKESL